MGYRNEKTNREFHNDLPHFRQHFAAVFSCVFYTILYPLSFLWDYGYGGRNRCKKDWF